MKKQWVSILLAGLLIFLVGCGAKDNAESAFDTMMKAFQTGETESIEPYYDFGEKSQFINADAAQDMLQVVVNTLKEMEYHPESVEKLDGSHVKITARVTTVDFSQVINLYIEQLMLMVEDESYQAQVSGMEQEDYQKMIADRMTELLSSEELGTEEKSVSVTMVKQEDGTWLPGDDKDEFFGAMFGNLIDAVNSLI